MIHKGVGYRTPRTQAIKLGTSPKGFEGMVNYDSMAGVPASMSHGHYQDSADDAKLPAGKAKPSVSHGAPFLLK